MIIRDEWGEWHVPDEIESVVDLAPPPMTYEEIFRPLEPVTSSARQIYVDWPGPPPKLEPLPRPTPEQLRDRFRLWVELNGAPAGLGMLKQFGARKITDVSEEAAPWLFYALGDPVAEALGYDG